MLVKTDDLTFSISNYSHHYIEEGIDDGDQTCFVHVCFKDGSGVRKEHETLEGANGDFNNITRQIEVFVQKAYEVFEA